MKISASKHRQFVARMSTAETSLKATLKLLRELFDDMRVYREPAGTNRLEWAHFEGWLDALQAIGNSDVLANHPELRTQLLNEIEAKALVSRPALEKNEADASPPSDAAVDPVDGIVTG